MNGATFCLQEYIYISVVIKMFLSTLHYIKNLLNIQAHQIESMSFHNILKERSAYKDA